MTTLPNPLGVLAFLTPGTQEIAIIVFLAFLLFGAKKIPELMRSLGRAQGEYQQAKRQFDAEVKGESGSRATKATAIETPQGEIEADPEDDAALVGARAEASALGIDTAGKSLETLRKEIEDARAKKDG